MGTEEGESWSLCEPLPGVDLRPQLGVRAEEAANVRDVLTLGQLT